MDVPSSTTQIRNEERLNGKTRLTPSRVLTVTVDLAKVPGSSILEEPRGSSEGQEATQAREQARFVDVEATSGRRFQQRQNQKKYIKKNLALRDIKSTSQVMWPSGWAEAG